MKPILWIDLEMTGLDDKVHHIIEVAAIITGKDFEVLDEYHRIVKQPQEVIDLMDDWCKKTHGASGLTEAIPNGTPLPEVEAELLDLVKRHYTPDDRPILAGNSVGNDRRFIDAYLPKFSEKLHYRIIDVSSFKEIYMSCYGLQFTKKNSHRALDDIKESINELQYYLSFLDPDKIKKQREASENG